MPTERDPDVQHAQQALLQRVVAAVTTAHAGGDKVVITEALERGLAEAGFSPQPESWLEATASEIAENRHVVVDRTLGSATNPGDDVHVEGTGRT